MKVNLILAAVCICINLRSVLAAGAGRALPIETENYVERLFRSINNRIEYDSSNFLVDLSGNYANCNYVGRTQLSSADRDTLEGATIGVIQDSTFSSGTDAGSVDSDVRPMLDSWVNGFDSSTAYFRAQIQSADTFGCSVRPGCSGQVVMACLFSPRYDRPQNDPTVNPNAQGVLALAFNRDEYKMAEQATGKEWDADHFLENLSGTMTQCAMIGRISWDFRTVIEIAEERGKSVTGIFGYIENSGSTGDAIQAILNYIRNNAENDEKVVDFLPLLDEDVKKEVGCSVIPDCLDSNGVDRYVVVSCLVEV